ncbi:tyrosine-type recombinase/integrase [Pseudoxanthomonas daejeonensis]|nr:site-specific integrase [Pseudoxanthomonas daejeonensis]
MAKKSKVELEKGVERRKNHFRFRHRTQWMEGNERKFHVHTQTFEFLPDKDCLLQNLPPKNGLWEANALADANNYSNNYFHDLTRQGMTGRRETMVAGTFREWLERYRDEGLKGHAYGHPDTPAPFALEPRAQEGRTHDIGQINTLLRMGGFAVDGDEEVLTNPRRRANALKNRPLVSAPVGAILKADIQALTQANFRTILNLWSHGTAKPDTKRRLRTTLRMCFKFHADYYDMKAPMDWLAGEIKGTGEKGKARALTRDEWGKVDKALTASHMHPSVEAALRFIRWTGCRRAEAFRLRWEQVRWPTASLRDMPTTVEFLRTKAARGTYKDRTIAIPDQAVDALRLAAGIGPKSQDWPKQGWVFPQPKPGQNRLAGQDPVAGQTVYTAFKRLFVAPGATPPANVSLVAMGVAPASPHILRHTRATEMSVIMPATQLMEYFGWDDPETIKIYVKLAEEMGLLVRDSDNLLRPAAQLQSEQNVRDYGKGLSIKQQEALVAKMAADLAERKATSKARKRP